MVYWRILEGVLYGMRYVYFVYGRWLEGFFFVILNYIESVVESDGRNMIRLWVDDVSRWVLYIRLGGFLSLCLS